MHRSSILDERPESSRLTDESAHVGRAAAPPSQGASHGTPDDAAYPQPKSHVR